MEIGFETGDYDYGKQQLEVGFPRNAGVVTNDDINQEAVLFRFVLLAFGGG